MKIRNGFVSNSSSASYILDLSMNKDKIFCEIFNEFYYSWANIEKTIEQIENRIESIKKYYPDDDQKYYEDILTYLKSVNNLDEKWNYHDDIKIKIIEAILKFNDIDCQTDGNTTRFIGHITMHNSLSDVHSILKDILLLMHIYYPKKKCHIKIDQD